MHGFIQINGGVTLSNRVLQILRELGNTVFTVGASSWNLVPMTKAIFKPRCARVPRANPLAGGDAGATRGQALAGESAHTLSLTRFCPDHCCLLAKIAK